MAAVATRTLLQALSKFTPCAETGYMMIFTFKRIACIDGMSDVMSVRLILGRGCLLVSCLKPVALDLSGFQYLHGVVPQRIPIHRHVSDLAISSAAERSNEGTTCHSCYIPIVRGINVVVT